jgi:undecaprenyl phosphate-alpha-L-ara4N flippase subunit ArnF
MIASPREVITRCGRQGLLWCAGSILLVTVAQLALKYAMLRLPLLTLESLPLLWEARRPLAMLAGGLGAYGLSMLCWFLALRRLPLNYAYPMLSISYVLVYLAAVALPWFEESATVLKSCGILVILFGVWLINSGNSRSG